MNKIGIFSDDPFFSQKNYEENSSKTLTYKENSSDLDTLANAAMNILEKNTQKRDCSYSNDSKNNSNKKICITKKNKSSDLTKKISPIRKNKNTALIQKIDDLKKNLENQKDMRQNHFSWDEHINEIKNAFLYLNTKDQEEIKNLPISKFIVVAQGHLANMGVYVSSSSIRNQLKYEPLNSFINEIFSKKIGKAIRGLSEKNVHL